MLPSSANTCTPMVATDSFWSIVPTLPPAWSGSMRAHGLRAADLGLPDSQGLETLTAAARGAADGERRRPHRRLADEEVGLRAVQLGAQDYLVKGSFGDYVLVRAARYAMERTRLVSRLEELARSDQLTGLRTGRVFLQALDHAVQQAPRSSLPGPGRLHHVQRRHSSVAGALDAEALLTTAGGHVRRQRAGGARSVMA